MKRGLVSGALALALILTRPASGGPLAVAPAASGAAETFVVVVGYNGAALGLPPLQHADDDAVRMAVLFSGLYGAGRVWLLAEPDAETRATMHEAGVTVPRHSQPTRAGLFAALEQVRAAAAQTAPGRPTTLYFFYAGHGLQGRFLLKPEGAPEAAMTGHELRNALAAVPVDRLLLFFDACRSQSLFTPRGTDPEIGPDLMAGISALEERARRLPIGVLTAAASAHPAGESKALRAGYFSHVLGSGLAGGADADGDQVVSFGELAAFVAFNTERLTGQRPWFSPPQGDLAATVLDLRGRSPRLEVRKEGSGRYLIGAGPGMPIFAETFKAATRAVQFYLPPGKYRVTHVSEHKSAETTEVTLGLDSLATVSETGWSAAPLPLPAARARGGGEPGREQATEIDGLEVTGFTAPFTPAIVSALTAGYHAGREPMAEAPVGRAPLLGALGLVSPAPLGLAGPQPGGVVVYLHGLGAGGLVGGFAGGSAELATSTHRADGAAYRLWRMHLGLRAGARLSLLSGLWLAPFATLGWEGLVRSAQRDSGDLLVPLAGLGATCLIGLGGRVGLLVEGRYQLRWIDVDGRARLSRGPSLAVGLGWGL